VNYSLGEKIYLRDMLTEKEGVPFSMALMLEVLYSQVENETIQRQEI